MLWWLVVVWLVVVGGTSVWLGLRGLALARHVSQAQRALEPRIAELQGVGLAGLASRSAELQARVARLQTAVERLNRSLERLRLLFSTWNGATRPLRSLLRLFRP